MNYSCGNCKFLKYREGYLYPYQCKYSKSVALTVNGLEKKN